MNPPHSIPTMHGREDQIYSYVRTLSPFFPGDLALNLHSIPGPPPSKSYRHGYQTVGYAWVWVRPPAVWHSWLCSVPYIRTWVPEDWDVPAKLAFSSFHVVNIVYRISNISILELQYEYPWEISIIRQHHCLDTLFVINLLLLDWWPICARFANSNSL